MFVCHPQKGINTYIHTYSECYGSNCISKCIQQNIQFVYYTVSFSYHIVGLWFLSLFFLQRDWCLLLRHFLSVSCHFNTPCLHFVAHHDKHFALEAIRQIRLWMSWKCFSCCRFLISEFSLFLSIALSWFALHCIASF